MKANKIKQIKALLSRNEAKGVDAIYIQPKPTDDPVLYREIPNHTEKGVEIYVTSEKTAIELLKIMEG